LREGIVVDAHRGDGKRFIVHADEKLSAFVELESACSQRAHPLKVPPRSESDVRILLACFASITLADDFKTIEGKEYKNVKVSRVEPDGVVITFSGGIVKIPFTELPPEVQAKFGYNPQAATDYQKQAYEAVSRERKNSLRGNRDRQKKGQSIGANIRLRRPRQWSNNPPPHPCTAVLLMNVRPGHRW
jgi:hypothetical protein